MIHHHPKIAPNLRHYQLVVAVACASLFGCSLEEPPARSIRGHTEVYSGVVHGQQAKLGPRYCQSCHGKTLSGGANGEPSCLQCHGQNWIAVPSKTSRAPNDHTKLFGGFRHKKENQRPLQYCIDCHGANLEGKTDLQTPSCILCHDKIWE